MRSYSMLSADKFCSHFPHPKLPFRNGLTISGTDVEANAPSPNYRVANYLLLVLVLSRRNSDAYGRSDSYDAYNYSYRHGVVRA